MGTQREISPPITLLLPKVTPDGLNRENIPHSPQFDKLRSFLDQPLRLIPTQLRQTSLKTPELAFSLKPAHGGLDTTAPLILGHTDGSIDIYLAHTPTIHITDDIRASQRGKYNYLPLVEIIDVSADIASAMRQALLQPATGLTNFEGIKAARAANTIEKRVIEAPDWHIHQLNLSPVVIDENQQLITTLELTGTPTKLDPQMKISITEDALYLGLTNLKQEALDVITISPDGTINTVAIPIAEARQYIAGTLGALFEYMENVEQNHQSIQRHLEATALIFMRALQHYDYTGREIANRPVNP